MPPGTATPSRRSLTLIVLTQPTFHLEAIGRGLPISDTISGLTDALAAGTGAAVVEAPPGTGKTTLVPPALANLTGGKILVTTPRRVAVRAAARRLSHLDASPLGTRVGFSVRGEHHSGSAVEFCTPGVLLQRLLSQPDLPGIAGVIVDEVHERQLDTDLCLGMLAELRELREDLQLIVMSATLDSARWATLLHAGVLSTPAVSHPITLSYHPLAGRAEISHSFLNDVAQLAVDATARYQASALVFLPGVREVTAVIDAIPDHIPAFPLHGQLSSQAQDLALQPSQSPRIVAATSIAETSLTVPGVRIVVDAGLSRQPRRNRQGRSGLVTVSESQSTAQQRAGRAGREGPGYVLRCFSQEEYQHFPQDITPEIRVSDLTQAALHLAAWGTPRGEGLPLLDAPPAAALEDAETTLQHLGVITETGTITPLGRKLAAIPADPRCAAALLRYGSQAAPTVAAMMDNPRGDLAHWHAPRREVERLRRLVPDRGAVSPGAVVAAAFPTQVGKIISSASQASRRGSTGHVAEAVNPDQDTVLLASGTRAQLPPELRGSLWVAAAEVSQTRRGAVIRSGAPLTQEEALSLGVTQHTVTEVIDGKVRGTQVTCLGAIELSSTPVSVPPELAQHALADVGLCLFTPSPKAQALMHRLDFLAKHKGPPWPVIEEQDPAIWLAPEIARVAKGEAASSVDIYPALQRLLPWPEATHLEDLAPEYLTVPSGHSHRLGYDTGRPVLKVKLQECFGLSNTPCFCGVPVLFHLLSPAARPLAVTDDLESFWNNAYQQVRADMRGRYPKHPWPEDPWSAPATASPSPRRMSKGTTGKRSSPRVGGGRNREK